MEAWLTLSLLTAASVFAAAVLAMIFAGWVGIGPRLIYALLLVFDAPVACYMTFYYSYFLNENTRVVGWPLPVVVFQRDNPDSPWLDFVGPTILLALPINYVLFMLIPSIAFLAVTYWKSRFESDSISPDETLDGARRIVDRPSSAN